MAKWVIDGKNSQEKTISNLQPKIAVQRSEIARITQALEAATKEKSALLADIKWMRGDK